MALTDKLTDIADAIRAKTGESGTMTLTEMATAIGNITTGGGSATLPDSMFVITGVGDYLFANDRWAYLIENYPTKWSINLTSAQQLAYYKTSNFPNNFPAINVNNGSLSYAFQSSEIEAPPIINGTGITQFTGGFNNSKIKTIPQDWFSHIEFQDNAYSMMINNMFNGALKLKGIINLQTHKANNFYTITSNQFYGFPLDGYGNNGSMSGLINIPVFSTTNASMSSKTLTCSYCYWLRQLKFSTDNGTPFVARLKNLTFDFTNCIGYFNFASYTLNNDGSLRSVGTELHNHYWDLTDAEIKDLQIYDATSYERLKNNPDAYSTKVEYSLYNKTSALETISTLPDVSAYGTCIIKFKGDAGSLTDGGAINTMTSAEIAAATAKGWTVSFA